jgi:hypothetical protein
MSFIASSNQKLLQLSNPTKYRESPTLTKKSETLRTGFNPSWESQHPHLKAIPAISKHL